MDIQATQAPERTSMGTIRHGFVGVKGDLRVELHYADLKDGQGDQACLYVFRFRDPKGGVLVPFTRMWMFDIRFGQADIDEDKLARVCMALANQLYGFATKQDQHRVLDAVVDYMDELKDHKPPPGMDKTLDQFLEECEREDLGFYFEVNGERVYG